MAITKSIGIDFGSTSIKLVKLAKGEQLTVETVATASIPAGTLFSDARADQELVASIVKKMFNDYQLKIKSVVAALPESQVFTRVVEMPALTDEELSSSIKWQAEQYIPLPLSEVNLDYSVVDRSRVKEKKMSVLLVAAPNRIIEWQTTMLELAGLSPTALETEILAASRVFSPLSSQDRGVIIVDCGATMTDMGILHNGSLVFTRSIKIAGNAITRAIAESFNFQPAQAEEYKKAYGLDEENLEGKVFQVIKPLIDHMVEELKKTMFFYQKKYNKKIQMVTLFGGGAYLPRFVSTLAALLEVEVQIGNPWAGLLVTADSASKQQSLSALYTVATGLALRNFR